MRKRPILSLAAALFMVLALFVLAAFAGEAVFANSYPAALSDRVKDLRETEGKRIILIGGSAVPFGIRPEMMEKNLDGWQVVPFGVYADMGLAPMLALLEGEIREGDFVILMPEFSEYVFSGRVNGVDLLMVLESDPSLLGPLMLPCGEDILWSLPEFDFRRIQAKIAGTGAEDGVYTRGAFDETGAIRESLRERNILPGGYDPGQEITLKTEWTDTDMTGRIVAFAERVREKGGEIVWHFPPMNERAVTGDPDAFYDALEETGIAVLGDPNRCVMAAGWFYDTNFHLNAAGAREFTQRLTEDIKVYLGDSSQTEIEKLPMPEIEEKTFEGDDSDADKFLTEEREEGLVITGLTEDGLQAETLVIPANVTGVDAGAFAGAEKLREVTAQENITLLPDGMLQGSGVKVLKLLGGPDKHIPGDHLTDGAEFRIQVEEAYLGDYLRNYFWQKYAARIFAGEN